MSDQPTATAADRKPLPGESEDYARARAALLAAEIDLQRQIDRVSAQRRALPPGPLAPADHRFEDERGAERSLADLFGDRDTLVVYFWMYGPERARPCPMCTNLLGPLNANAEDLRQHAALAVLGRSPVARQRAFASERGWRHLTFFRTGDAWARALGGLDAATGDEYPVLAVYRRHADGSVRLFWKGEMTGEMADPGKDPRGGPDLAPLWTVLDLTPHGRPDAWYPRLDYPPPAGSPSV